MDLNYYFTDKVRQLQVNQPCPGCGRINGLAVHDMRISYMKNKIQYWIGCSCGWRGPVADNPSQAVAAWDHRE